MGLRIDRTGILQHISHSIRAPLPAGVDGAVLPDRVRGGAEPAEAPSAQRLSRSMASQQPEQAGHRPRPAPAESQEDSECRRHARHHHGCPMPRIPDTWHNACSGTMMDDPFLSDSCKVHLTQSSRCVVRAQPGRCAGHASGARPAAGVWLRVKPPLLHLRGATDGESRLCCRVRPPCAGDVARHQ